VTLCIESGYNVVNINNSYMHLNNS